MNKHLPSHLFAPLDGATTPLQRRHLLALAAGAAALPASVMAQQSRDIVIGRTTALSGGMAPFLQPIHEGQDAAIADINAQGGIGGRKVRCVTLDDGFQATKALENARTLADKEGALALFGVAGTSQVMALLPYITETKLPLISVYTGSPSIRAQPNPYLFTTRASYADELVKIVRTLIAVQSSRIAVAFEANDFGKLMTPLVEKAIAAEGGTHTASQSVDSSGKDAEQAAKALAASKPQAVVLVAAGPSVVAYVKAHRAQMGVPIYTLSLGAGSAVLQALGEEARGLAVARTGPSPRQPTLQLTRDFQASMKRHDKPADYDRYTGYMDARVLIEGLKAAGTNPTRASLVQAMESLRQLDLGGLAYQFSPQNHHGLHYVDIAIVGRGGQFMQ